MGYSEKIGPVYFGDRDTAVSPHKLDEIEAEVRRYAPTPPYTIRPPVLLCHGSMPFGLRWKRHVLQDFMLS